MAANASTLAEIIRELWETPFTEALSRVSWLIRFFNQGGGGGDGLRWKVHYAGNSASTSYGLEDTPPAAGQQSYERAYLTWKRNWITVAVDGLLQAEAAGAGGFIEAQASEISEALQDLILSIDGQLWGDGTGNGGKDITGVAAAISATGTYATIDRATATWWQSYVEDAGAAILSEDLLTNHFDALFGDGSRGIDPNNFVMVTSRAMWRKLGRDIQDKHGSRRAQTTTLEGGQRAILVDDIPVVWAPTCPALTAWGFSREDWGFHILKAFDVVPLGKTRDADEAYINQYAQLRCKNPKRQSKIHNLV